MFLIVFGGVVAPKRTLEVLEVKRTLEVLEYQLHS